MFLIGFLTKFPFLFFFFLTFLAIPLFSENSLSAKENGLPSITVINSIRGLELGHEDDDLVTSLKAQWKITNDMGVNATWLFQYSTMEDEDIVDFAKNNMSSQEFGLFFEIDRNFAQKSGAQYRGQGPWYFSDGLFLVSYDLIERKKMIDTAFAKFKEIFGYYPKTVGAWWIGGDSLSYMQKHYGIKAALKASDQYDLDFYSLWGAPWGTSYISSKQNEGIPARSLENSSRVVILQWATRDPLRGYKDPLYSVQDYPTIGYDTKYFEYLSSVYLRDYLDNIVIGLENGGNIDDFNKSYKIFLEEARKLEKNHKVNIKLAKDYAEEFLAEETILPAPRFLLSKDYNSDNQSFWYNTENFRAAIHKVGNEIYLVDLRDYSGKIKEDFALLPNSSSRFRTDTPSIIDSMRFPKSKILITKSNESMRSMEKGNNVILYAGNEKVAELGPNFLRIFSSNNGHKQLFTFSTVKNDTSILFVLLGIYSFYFILLTIKRRNLKIILRDIAALSIPLLIASFFLYNNATFLFDRKEIFLLNFFPGFYFTSISQAILFFKIIPFIFLLVSHYIFIVKQKGSSSRMGFLAILGLVTLLYIHLPYFPLDRSTYSILFVVFGLITILLLTVPIVFFLKTGSKKRSALSFLGILFVLLILTGTTLISRSKYALTPFEQEALEVIKNQDKDIMFVYQTDFNIKPIYKAIRPALYENTRLGEKLTGRNWETVVRPEDNILKIENYDEKIIVVPRYLGSDISEYETTILGLRKIFDNAQIAIYEKD